MKLTDKQKKAFDLIGSAIVAAIQVKRVGRSSRMSWTFKSNELSVQVE